MNFIEVNGVSLRYAVQGSGKPLVLIHEMGGTMESWDLVVPALVGEAARGALRHARRGLLGEDPRRAEDRHHDRRPDRAARRARHQRRRSRSPAPRSAARSRCTRRSAFPSASRPRSSPAPRPRSRRPTAMPCWRASREFERDGLRVAFDAHRRQRLSGRTARRPGALRRLPRALARQRSGELRRDLPHARRHGPDAGARRDQMPGAGDRRRIRSRPAAARGRADRQGDPGREVQGAADRALCGLADAGADGRARSRRFWERSERRRPTLCERTLSERLIGRY